MDPIAALGFYLLGLITGASGVVALTIFIGKRALDRRKEEKTNRPTQASISDRMQRVKDITEEQLVLSQQADGPQKNSLDGKYKNGIIRQIKALDEEKNNILSSILSDGHDPELTTIDGQGVVSQMKLSEYMAYMGIKMEPKTKPKSTQIGKFTVVRGGKDDGGETTH